MARRGFVYILHFSQPYAHAQHYTGWTRDFPARFIAHLEGRGANLLRVVTAAGIGVELGRLWTGKPRAYEQQLKAIRQPRRYCLVCRQLGDTRRGSYVHGKI